MVTSPRRRNLIIVETFLFTTDLQVGDLPFFTFSFQTKSSHSCLLVVHALDENECIVLSDQQLPLAKTNEIRGEGIWSDINCEKTNEHWSFSLESFALRVSVDEYCTYRQNPETLLLGDRIAFGYELDLLSTDSEEWEMSGEILINKDEIEVSPQSVKLKYT